jgi:hypothetical protein
LLQLSLSCSCSTGIVVAAKSCEPEAITIGGIEEGLTTKGASGVREKPCIDAIVMESVFAFGEETETISVAEFAQANRTICAIFESADGAIEEHGESIDQSLIHSRVVHSEEML